MSFRDFLENNAGDAELPDVLPLVHSTRSSTFRAVSRGSRLSPRECPVFAEKLLYFFYGRPAYRVNSPRVHDIGYCPICFVLKPNTRIRVVRAFPFDSGAVRGGRVSDFIPADCFGFFRLRRSLRDARLVVKALYQENGEYLLGNVKKRLQGVPAKGLVRRYVELLRDSSTEASDDRRSAVEIQTNQDVDLASQLLAVVLPARLLDDVNVRNTVIQRWGALPITYPTYAATNPTEYSAVIRDCVVRFYREHRIIQ